MKKILLALSLCCAMQTSLYTIVDCAANQVKTYSSLSSLSFGFIANLPRSKSFLERLFYNGLGLIATDQWCGVLQAQAERGKYPEWRDGALWHEAHRIIKPNPNAKTVGFMGYALGALYAEGFKYAMPYVKKYFWAGIKRLRR